MSQTFRSLSEPNYRHWFAGALISNTGTWMQRTAQDWIVLTMLTDNNASALGFTMALQLGPQLIMFPFAGNLVDKFDKRRLLMVTQALLGIIGLILFALVITDVIVLWHVYVLAFTLGMLTTLDNPARQAFVSELVGEKLLPNAVSLNSASFNGARMIGPAVAGVLTALIGAGPVFLISGLGFAATLTVLIRLDKSRLHPSGRRGKGGVLGGLKYLRRRPDITVVLVVLFIIATFGFNFNIYTATMAKIEFGKDASGFGLLNSVMAIGSVTGALASARREKPRLRFIFGAAGGFGVAVGVASLMPNYYLFAASLVFVGFASLTMMTSANAYVQTTTAANYRGRVMAIYAAVVMGGTPIGAPLAGWVADAFGPRMALVVGAASGVIAFAVGLLWMVTAKDLRIHRDPKSRIRLHMSYQGRPPGTGHHGAGHLGTGHLGAFFGRDQHDRAADDGPGEALSADGRNTAASGGDHGEAAGESGLSSADGPASDGGHPSQSDPAGDGSPGDDEPSGDGPSGDGSSGDDDGPAGEGSPGRAANGGGD